MGIGDMLNAIGGDGAQGHLLIALAQQVGHQGGFCTGQDHEGDAACLFSLHQFAPGHGIVDLRGVLLITLEIVAPIATDIAAVGHIVRRFTQKKITPHLLPALAHPRIADQFGEFPLAGITNPSSLPTALQLDCPRLRSRLPLVPTRWIDSSHSGTQAAFRSTGHL
jgi:hypothetical protein